eukprot:1391898-Lingulodinium_polyedra.AAC.1
MDGRMDGMAVVWIDDRWIEPSITDAPTGNRCLVALVSWSAGLTHRVKCKQMPWLTAAIVAGRKSAPTACEARAALTMPTRGGNP